MADSSKTPPTCPKCGYSLGIGPWCEDCLKLRIESKKKTPNDGS